MMTDADKLAYCEFVKKIAGNAVEWIAGFYNSQNQLFVYPVFGDIRPALCRKHFGCDYGKLSDYQKHLIEEELDKWGAVARLITEDPALVERLEKHLDNPGSQLKTKTMMSFTHGNLISRTALTGHFKAALDPSSDKYDLDVLKAITNNLVDSATVDRLGMYRDLALYKMQARVASWFDNSAIDVDNMHNEVVASWVIYAIVRIAHALTDFTDV